LLADTCFYTDFRLLCTRRALGRRPLGRSGLLSAGARAIWFTGIDSRCRTLRHCKIWQKQVFSKYAISPMRMIASGRMRYSDLQKQKHAA
jgi:hypothetical protein